MNALKRKIGVLIVGAGKGGKALLEILVPASEIDIIGVADLKERAPGIKLAKELGISTSSDFREFIKDKNLSIIIDVTGNPRVTQEIDKSKPRTVELMGGGSAKLMWELVERVSNSERRIKNYVNSLLTLSRLSQTISSTLDLEKLLDLVVGQAVKILKVEVCSLRLLDEGGENLILVASIGHSEEYVEKKRILKLKESLAGLAVLERKPIAIENVLEDPRYTLPSLAKEAKLRSLLSVPLIEKEKVIGVLNVYTHRRHIFTEGEKELLSLFAGQVALAITNARLYEKLEEHTRNLEQKVKEQTEKLLHQEKLAAIGQLASGIAHELRNPLAVIKTAAYYLRSVYRQVEQITETRRIGGLADKTTKHFDLIEKQISVSVRIINDLLEFARVPKISLEPVEINKILENALELTEKPRRINLVKDFAADLPKVYADGDRLHQVFSNLISNAYDAMSEGGELVISTKVSDSVLEVIFQDSGSGIAKENLEKIFDPLFTTKSKGTGLGLAVCESIINAHQGEIKVKSEVGKGTTLTIKLPVTRIAADEKPG